MQIYCTRPSCPKPVNSFGDLDDTSILKTVSQKYCISCGMPLILDGRYLPLQVLRRGGFGAAFLACDRRTPTFRRCVVKQFQPHPSLNADQLDTATRLFHREAEVLEDLGNHPKIPQFFAFLEFTAPPWNSSLPQKFFYLVQEYIDGRNLQQEVEEKGPFAEADVVKVLKEVLEILEFVHNRGSIHRDIKPSNIMRDRDGALYLIDFGAVKQVTITGSGNPSASTVQPFQSLTGIFTPEYAPPEQRQCRAVFPSSDLYALAVTCVHLLTGKSPQYLFDSYTNRWNWRPEAQVSDRLANILDRMLLENPHERFISAREVLEALTLPSLPPQPTPINPRSAPIGQRTIAKWPFRHPKILAGVFTAGVLALGVFGTTVAWFFYNNPGNPIANRASFGEKILIANEGDDSRDPDRFESLKKQGIEAFERKDYETAARRFQEALNIYANAPETRIYLNNAQALMGNSNPYVIAIPVPITDQTKTDRFKFRALEMLRGVAQAQKEINENGGINGNKIKLEIVNDEERSEVGEEIAKALVKDRRVLAVIGHNSSPVSMAAAKIYNDEKLTFITPISITKELTGPDKPYIFRTNTKSDSVAKNLADYMLDKLQKKKVAIFYNSTATYSKELTTELDRELAERQSPDIKIVDRFDFSLDSFNAEDSLRQATQNGAEVIVLFPLKKDTNKAVEVLKLQNRNYPQLKVIGDIATLYSADTLTKAKDFAVGMVLLVSWHAASETSSQSFYCPSKKLWGGGTVNWATATSYNATTAIIQALKQDSNPTRESVQKALSQGTFTGTSGDFRFIGGDATGNLIPVEVKKTDTTYPFTSNTGFDFVPIGYNLTPLPQLPVKTLCEK